MVTRRATLSGVFYPGNPALLQKTLDDFYESAELSSFYSSYHKDAHTVYGIAAPHAGITYSGLCAAYAYSVIPEDFSGTFAVIGPSHNGFPTCLSSAGWETPLGVVECDTDLTEELSKYIPVDDRAVSVRENSIELQMLFIKHRFPEAECACIMIGNQSEKSAENLGRAIYNAVSDTNTNAVTAASSDFSHYIPARVAEKYDNYAAEALKNLDITEFYRRIREVSLSACGYGAIAAMTVCSKLRGAAEGRLLKYTTSGSVTNDYSEVVGYAALSMEK